MRLSFHWMIRCFSASTASFNVVINDQRLALIREYAQAYEKMTDEIANRLAQAALDLEARRNALKTKYYERLTTILPARTAARVLQVENQILLLLDLQIAASLPVIE